MLLQIHDLAHACLRSQMITFDSRRVANKVKMATCAQWELAILTWEPQQGQHHYKRWPGKDM